MAMGRPGQGLSQLLVGAWGSFTFCQAMLCSAARNALSQGGAYTVDASIQDASILGSGLQCTKTPSSSKPLAKVGPLRCELFSARPTNGAAERLGGRRQSAVEGHDEPAIGGIAAGGVECLQARVERAKAHRFRARGGTERFRLLQQLRPEALRAMLLWWMEGFDGFD